jgi:membrane protease YdiL (CAAX protease family)
MYAVAFPIYCVLVRKIPKAEQREKSTVRFGEFLALFAICLLMMQLGGYVSLIAKEYLSSRFALPSDLQMTYSLLAAGDVIPEILFAVILAPIFEELIFRKLMIDRLSIYGDRLAVIVSSIAFGLFHGNITQLFFATMIGFVLGHIYTKTRRVSYTIVIHMLVNLFGTLPYVIYYLIDDEVLISTSVSVPMEGLGIAYNVFIIIHFALLVFGFVMLLVALFAKKYRLSRLCDVEIPVTKFLGVVVLNKGTLLFFAYCVLNIVLTFLIVGQ